MPSARGLSLNFKMTAELVPAPLSANPQGLTARLKSKNIGKIRKMFFMDSLSLGKNCLVKFYPKINGVTRKAAQKGYNSFPIY